MKIILISQWRNTMLRCLYNTVHKHTYSPGELISSVSRSELTTYTQHMFLLKHHVDRLYQVPLYLLLIVKRAGVIISMELIPYESKWFFTFAVFIGHVWCFLWVTFSRFVFSINTYNGYTYIMWPFPMWWPFCYSYVHQVVNRDSLR